MTDLEKAARQALEALEVSTDWDMNATGKQAQSMKAITVLRRALAEQPAQRTWVGLTDEERFKVAEQTGCMSADWLDVIKATETALQIKNQ